EEVAALEVQQVDEVVDDPGEIVVGNQRMEVRVDLEPVDHPETLQDRYRNGNQPEALPVIRRLAVERDHVRVEDLVADRLVEQPIVGDADRAVGVGDPLRLEEQRLSEPLLGGYDDLIVPLRPE